MAWVPARLQSTWRWYRPDIWCNGRRRNARPLRMKSSGIHDEGSAVMPCSRTRPWLASTECQTSALQLHWHVRWSGQITSQSGRSRFLCQRNMEYSSIRHGRRPTTIGVLTRAWVACRSELTTAIHTSGEPPESCLRCTARHGGNLPLPMDGSARIAGGDQSIDCLDQLAWM